MRNILIIKLSALGDIVQAEGAMHDIRLHHKDAVITVLTTPPYKRIMELCPWVDRIIIDQRVSCFHIGKILSLRKILRSSNFDMVYDLQQVDRTRMYNRLFLHDSKWMGDSKSCTYYLRRPKGSSAADHFARHLQKTGVETVHTLKSDISWMANDAADEISKYNLPETFIVLIPGGSIPHPQKRWPFYTELAQKLLDAGHLPVTVPGPDEMDLCKNIPGVMMTKNGSYLDYFQLAGVLKNAAFIIGNDTGPTHIGAHLQRQGLALFGGHTSAESTGIQHTTFNWLEETDLRELSLERVWSQMTGGDGGL